MNYNFSTVDNVVTLRKVLLDNIYVPIRLLTDKKENYDDGYLEAAHADPEACLQEDGTHLNTGISCRGLRVVDIDCDDSNLVKRIRDAAEKHICESGAVRYRANSPRIALVYRAADTDRIPNTIGKVKGRQVQVLSNGHILAYGRHPSGAMLQWERDQGPAYWRLKDLNPATADDLLVFIDAACEILGCDKPGRPNEKDLSTFTEFPNWTLDDIRTAFDHLPNDDTDRSIWLKIGYAAWDAADKSELDHKEVFESWTDWSNKNPNYGDQTSECQKTWDSFHRNPPRDVTAATLIRSVREAIGDDIWLPPSWTATVSVVDDEPIDDDEEEDEAGSPPSSDPKTTTKGKRPGIRCIQGLRHLVVDRAEKLLIEAGVPIYQRSGILVTPKLEPQKDREGRTVNVMVLAPVTLDGLLTEMTRVIRWRVARKVGKAIVWQKVDAPPEYARAILASDRNWSFPRIVGILTAPTLRPDGSLLDKPGYDEVTGYYLVDTDLGDIKLKDKPTREDAMAELKFIHGLYTDIPFVGDLVEGSDGIWQNAPYDPNKPNLSRSVADSMLIAPMIMLLIGKPPGHAVIAPDYGSGKSYVGDLSHNIAAGVNCPVINASVDDKELTKVLDAQAMKGSQFICLDNATQSIRNVRLSQILSQDFIEARVLGLSKDLTIAYNPFVIINGNNVPPNRDMKRRVVVCYLDAQMERPYLREFDADNRRTIRSSRGRYISAILTMVRAYMVADMPNKVKRLASFEGWSDYVASMLVWLDEASPILSIEANSGSDPEGNSINDVMDEIERELLKREPSEHVTNGEAKIDLVKGFVFKVSELLNYANKSQDWFYVRGMKPDLYIALASVGKANANGIDAVSIGRWLSRVSGQIHGGRRFRMIEKVGKSKVSNLWVFECAPFGVDVKLVNIKNLKSYQDALKEPIDHLEEQQLERQKAAFKLIDEDEKQTKH